MAEPKLTTAELGMNTFNAIRSELSTYFRDRIPEGTQDNISEIGKSINTFDVLANEYVDGLFMMIGIQSVEEKSFTNPLAPFKKGTLANGAIAQKLYANPTKAVDFSADGITSDGKGGTRNMLSRSLPDVKVNYIYQNRQSEYDVTVSPEQLQSAFMSWDGVDQLTNLVINKMYVGDEVDEFILMKELIVQGVANNMLVTMEVADPLDPVNGEKNGKDFIKKVNTVSGKMRFPSTIYNRYIEQPGATGEPAITWCDRKNQVILMATEILTSVSLDVLAFSFQLSLADFRARVIEVDDFNGTNIGAVICDEALIQVYDTLRKTKSFENGKGLYQNYWYHHWQAMGLFMCANCVVFTIGEFKKPHKISSTVESDITYDAIINSSDKALDGDTVMVTAKNTNADGFEIKSASGVTITALSSDKNITTNDFMLTFTMPNEDVTINWYRI